MNNTPQPRKRPSSSGRHDSMFKFGFSDRRTAAELSGFLPSALVDQLDFTTLELEPSTFVSSKLRQLHADCMYRVKTKTNHDAYIVLIIEHQSTVDWWMPVRLMEYGLAFWKRLRRTKSKPGTKGTRSKKEPPTKLPYLFPILLYNGPGTYPGPTTLHEMIQLPGGLEPAEAATYGLNITCFPLSLANISDERLSATERLGLTLLALKYPLASAPLGLMTQMVSKLPKDEQMEYIDAYFRYNVGEREDTSPQDVERLEHYFQSYGVNTMTLGEKWRQEGLEKGLEKGREEGIGIGLEKGREEGIGIGLEKGIGIGQEKVARNLLDLGLDLNLIQKATGLAMELLQKMRSGMNSSPQT